MTPKATSSIQDTESYSLYGRTWFCLSLLLILLTIHNGWWLHRDVSAPFRDEAHYLLGSLEVFETLRDNGISALKDLYFMGEGPRPISLLAISSLPFYAMFGASADVAILSTNTIFTAILILSTFLLGRRLFGTRTGLLATFVTVMTPGLSLLTRIYWPHFSVAAITALGTYLLLKSDGFSRTFPSLGFGLVLGLGLMIRPVYPALFLLAPLSWVIGQAFFNGIAVSDLRSLLSKCVISQIRCNILTRLVGRALPSLILVLIIAGPYYLPIVVDTIRFVSTVQSENNLLLTSNALFYLQKLPKYISPFVSFLLAIGIVFGLKKLTPSTRFLLFSLLGTFIVISVPSFKRSYYIPPIFPLLSIAATYWIFGIYNSWLRRGLVTITVIMCLGAYFVTAWGFPAFPNSTFLQKVFIFNVQISKPNRIDWQMSTIADLIRSDCGATSVPKVGFLGETMLDIMTFRYLAGSKADNFTYTPQAPFALAEINTLLMADYVLISRPYKQYGIKQQSLQEMRRMMPYPGAQYWHSIFWDAIVGGKAPNSTFSNYHYMLGKVVLQDGLQIEVYARKKAISTDEISDLSSEMIALDPEIAVQQLEFILERQEPIEPDLLVAYKKSLALAKRMQQSRAE